jgi:hypothetical protein
LGGFNTLVVLDLDFVPGSRGRQVLKATREWITSEKGFEASLSLSGPLGNGWDPGWLPFGGGVAHVEETPDAKRLPASRPDIPEDPLEPDVYHWDQTIRHPVYGLILILPSGTTLKSASPEPNSAGDLGDRFVVFWLSISENDLVRNVDISWHLVAYAGGDRDLEVNRLRTQLPLSVRRRASALRRITYMRRGLGISLLIIALIALWISLPSGLSISPFHITAATRIPATIICVISAVLSVVGLAKGWSLADLFVTAGESARDG